MTYVKDGLFAVWVVSYALAGGWSLASHYAVLPIVMLFAFWPLVALWAKYVGDSCPE